MAREMLGEAWYRVPVYRVPTAVPNIYLASLGTEYRRLKHAWSCQSLSMHRQHSDVGGGGDDDDSLPVSNYCRLRCVYFDCDATGC